MANPRYEDLSIWEKKRYLQEAIVEEVRAREVIYNTDNNHFLKKGGKSYSNAFTEITQVLKNTLSPKLDGESNFVKLCT